MEIIHTLVLVVSSIGIIIDHDQDLKSFASFIGGSIGLQSRNKTQKRTHIKKKNVTKDTAKLVVYYFKFWIEHIKILIISNSEKNCIRSSRYSRKTAKIVTL